jgi:hypothetical protein
MDIAWVQNVCGEQQNKIIDVHDVHVRILAKVCVASQAAL